MNISDRNLRRLHDYIQKHRMPWTMVTARDFAKDIEPIVTATPFAEISEAE